MHILNLNSTRSKLTKLLVKRQYLYEYDASTGHSLDDCINAYITSTLVPLWPSGWIKASEIRSQFLKSGKSKIRDPNRPNAGTTERSSSKEHEPSRKPSTHTSFNSDKSKTHIPKESSSKSSKSSGDRIVAKAVRKHEKHNELITDQSMQNVPKLTKTLPNTVR